MPFMYKPSIWGFTASAIFIVLTISEIQDTQWVDALMWALLAFSFTVKYMPKFLIFNLQASMASFVTLIAGGAMFIAEASEKLGSN